MDKEKQDKIIEEARMKIAISNFEKGEEIMRPTNKILKMVATFMIALGVTTGLVYASSKVYENIWKQPEKYNISYELTENEKETAITEEDAKKKAAEYLNKIGLDNDIKNSTLIKDGLKDEVQWDISFEDGSMIMNDKGEFISLNIPSFNYTIPYNYGITREEARKVAKELLEKYKPQDDNGEYQLVKLTGNMQTDEGSYIWYADFYKKYGELLNPYENIKIGWIPTINGLYSLSFENSTYENNEEKISKEDAVKIATEKDKQIETKKAIKETLAEVEIKQMNENVYLRENFKEDYEKGFIHTIMQKTGDNTYELKEDATLYKTEKRVRKVWVVVIKYDVSENTGVSEFSYYIDCTTGEIIGGSIGDSTKTIEQIISDPYNLIEK